jgi:hypothetical protein
VRQPARQQRDQVGDLLVVNIVGGVAQNARRRRCRGWSSAHEGERVGGRRRLAGEHDQGHQCVVVGVLSTCHERVGVSGPGRPAGGRPPTFDQALCKKRNVVERCFGRLKQFRGLATRYAKRVAYYRAEVVIATIAIWLRHHSQDTP